MPSSSTRPNEAAFEFDGVSTAADGAGAACVAGALASVAASTLVVSVDTDRLYRPEQQAVLAAGIPGATLTTVASPYGHDGFLIEVDAVGGLVAGLLGDAAVGGSAG